jgi:GNAT superfamily N-acetyltransferase
MSIRIRNVARGRDARLRRKVRRVRTAAGYDTFRGLVAKSLGHVVYRRVVLVGRRLDVPLPEAQSDLELSMGLLTEGEVESYVAFRPEADAATVRRRMAAGWLVYAVWHDGRIVSVTWLVPGTAHLDPVGVRLHLDPRDSYGRDSFTARAVRGRNVGTVCMVGALQALREAGYECSFGFVLPENRRGFGPPAKAGLDRLGSIGWVGLGPARVYFVALAGGGLTLHPRLKRPRKLVDIELGRPCHSAPPAQAKGSLRDGRA